MLFAIMAGTAWMTWWPKYTAIPCESESPLQKQSTSVNWYSFIPKSFDKSDLPKNMNKETVVPQINTLNTSHTTGRTAHLAATKESDDQFVLTAYSLDETCTGKSPGMKDFGITASGAPAQVGVTVAVDPNIIAYGSIIYIAGLGWRIAEDTGGAIKGNHIDVLVKSYTEAVHFGVKRHQHVKIFSSNSRMQKSNMFNKNASLINIRDT